MRRKKRKFEYATIHGVRCRMERVESVTASEWSWRTHHTTASGAAQAVEGCLCRGEYGYHETRSRRSAAALWRITPDPVRPGDTFLVSMEGLYRAT